MKVGDLKRALIKESYYYSDGDLNLQGVGTVDDLEMMLMNVPQCFTNKELLVRIVSLHGKGRDSSIVGYCISDKLEYDGFVNDNYVLTGGITAEHYRTWADFEKAYCLINGGMSVDDCDGYTSLKNLSWAQFALRIVKSEGARLFVCYDEKKLEQVEKKIKKVSSGIVPVRVGFNL